jgi:hypothetical protein
VGRESKRKTRDKQTLLPFCVCHYLRPASPFKIYTRVQLLPFSVPHVLQRASKGKPRFTWPLGTFFVVVVIPALLFQYPKTSVYFFAHNDAMQPGTGV